MPMLKSTMRRLRGIRKNQSGLRGPVVGMRLVFRAEVMPGRETDQRTFEVTRVLTSGRIELANLQGEHALTEFESLPG
jgi:hypothetical protein